MALKTERGTQMYTKQIIDKPVPQQTSQFYTEDCIVPLVRKNLQKQYTLFQKLGKTVWF